MGEAPGVGTPDGVAGGMADNPVEDHEAKIVAMFKINTAPW